MRMKRFSDFISVKITQPFLERKTSGPWKSGLCNLVLYSVEIVHWNNIKVSLSSLPPLLSAHQEEGGLHLFPPAPLHLNNPYAVPQVPPVFLDFVRPKNNLWLFQSCPSWDTYPDWSASRTNQANYYKVCGSAFCLHSAICFPSSCRNISSLRSQ